MTNSFLSGIKIYLRALRPQDCDGPYADWINSQKGDVFTEHALYPHSPLSLRQYLESANHSDSRLLLGIFTHRDDRHVGNIELRNINHMHKTAEYLVFLDPEMHGEGYASEASRLLLNHAFIRLNLCRIELSVRDDNFPAIQLYQRLGFQKEGIKREAFLGNGLRYDVICMGILKGEWVLLDG